jgi:hypothetical protein
MNNWWRRWNRSLDRPFAQMRDGHEGHSMATMIRLAAMLEELEAGGGTGPNPSPPPPPSKSFVTELCNRLHQLSRTVKKASDQQGPESDRLKTHMERLDKTLREYSIGWEDLTGQAYHPGRADFEPLGEPRSQAGLTRDTIVQCDRPVVRIDGRVVQSAKGVVGTPPDGQP